MANLGSSNTPISGESFDLPSGWSFEENVDGEVIITDSGGTTIGRRDETNGKWVFDSIVSDTLEATDSITDPEGNTVTSLSDPVRVTEEASTFTESDVTVTNNSTVVDNGSIKLVSGPQISREPDDDSVGISSKNLNGLVFNPSRNLSGISVEISGNTTNITRVVLQDFNENTITSKTGLSLDAGDTVSLSASLSSETDYRIVGDANGGSHTRGQDNDPSYPFTGNSLDIVSGAFPGGTTTGKAYNFLKVDKQVSLATSGDALVSFDSGSPSDIDSYDLATFQRTLDGETVTIDVVDSNGNVLKSDISKDTDISDIATATDVQLRANLSRNDTANNPTVDYLARRFIR